MANVSYKVVDNMIDMEVSEHGVVLYKNKISRTKKMMYEKFIEARLDILLQDCGKLHTPYVMFELGGMMWRCDDLDRADYRSLKRAASPLFYTTEESRTIDLIFDSTLYDFFPYEKDSLVYMFDKFWMNGECLGSMDLLKWKLGFKRNKTLNFYGDDIQLVKQYFENEKDVTIKSIITSDSQTYF